MNELSELTSAKPGLLCSSSQTFTSISDVRRRALLLDCGVMPLSVGFTEHIVLSYSSISPMSSCRLDVSCPSNM